MAYRYIHWLNKTKENVKSIKVSVLQLQKVIDTTTLFIINLKSATGNPDAPIGVLLNDEEAGTHLKETIKNLESSSKKLDEDLEAAQHNFLLRGFSRKKTAKNIPPWTTGSFRIGITLRP